MRTRRGGIGSGGHSEGNSERWLLTYADMITLLLVLFIVLFALSTINMRKYAQFESGLVHVNSPNVNPILQKGSGLLHGGQSLLSHPGAINPPAPAVALHLPQPTTLQSPASSGIPPASLAAVAKLLQARLAAAGMSNDVQVQLHPGALVIQLIADKLFFASDSAALGSQGQLVVDTIGQVLGPLSNAVQVDGYTDNQPVLSGPYPTNWELSAIRGVNVLRRLLGDGVAPVRLSATAFGSAHPLVPNSSPANQARNRRVNIVVLGTSVLPQLPASASTPAAATGSVSAAASSAIAPSTGSTPGTAVPGATVPGATTVPVTTASTPPPTTPALAPLSQNLRFLPTLHLP